MLLMHSLSRTKKLVGAGVALVLILLGAWVWHTSAKGDEVVGTLHDLATLRTPSACTLAYSDDTLSATGTVYSSEGRVRGDFTFHIILTGETIHTSVIDMDGTRYSWTPDALFGEETPLATATSTSVDTLYHYTCREQTVSASVFELPNDIAFVEKE